MGDRPAFLWIGNHAATDLCNTEPVIDGRSVELLPDAAAVVSWARLASVSTVAAGTITGRDRTRTVEFVRRLRGAVRVLLEGDVTDAAGMAALNAVLGEQEGALHVDTTASDPVSLAGGGGGAQLRLDIAAAVVDIFRHDRRLVRRCANPACVLLYLDTSKSGRRRWCDMAICGNRAKAAAHYARTTARARRS